MKTPCAEGEQSGGWILASAPLRLPAQKQAEVPASAGMLWRCSLCLRAGSLCACDMTQAD